MCLQIESESSLRYELAYTVFLFLYHLSMLVHAMAIPLVCTVGSVHVLALYLERCKQHCLVLVAKIFHGVQRRLRNNLGDKVVYQDLLHISGHWLGFVPEDQ